MIWIKTALGWFRGLIDGAPFEPIIPKNLDEAVNHLFIQLSEEDKLRLKEGKWSSFNGIAIRNQWGLWTGSVLAQWFKDTYGLGHADDMFQIIQEATIAKVKGEEYNPQWTVDRCKRHWEMFHVDPLTQEIVGPPILSFDFSEEGMTNVVYKTVGNGT